jgi:acyl carrier protein
MTASPTDSTFDLIRGVICKATKLPPEAVRLENPVTGLQNVDSIVLLEIVARVEITLGISIDEQVLFEIQTVGDFVNVCNRLIAEGAAGDAVAGATR